MAARIHTGLRLSAVLSLFAFTVIGPRAIGQNRIDLHGNPLFVSGSNIAWINFAADVGPGVTDLDAFRIMFDSLQATGGNSMRLWLHTNGAQTPEFDAAGIVSGPGQGTIADLTAILDLAWERRVGLVLCLWSFDMLRRTYGPAITGRAQRLLTDDAALTAYVQNALLPIVSAVRGHPAIVAWEVLNEAEGMSNEYGWDFTYHVPMASIQRFVNRIAGAIHRADSSSLVTTGAWSFISQSDVNFLAKDLAEPQYNQEVAEWQRSAEAAFGIHYKAAATYAQIRARFQATQNTNYYRDDRLIAAGGDRDGTLDFYSVHYYAWAGAGLSPFHHTAQAWNVGKPLVIAEFFVEDAFTVPYRDLYKTLFVNGYAGALSWQWHANPDQQTKTADALRGIAREWPWDVDIDPRRGKIYQFYASSTAIEIGETSRLRWKVSRGSAVTLNGAGVGINDSAEVSPDETTEYILRAAGDQVQSDSVTVFVYQPGEILSFSATPASILRGEPTTLSWQTARGSSVTLNGVPVGEDESHTLFPDSSTLYTLVTSGQVRDTASVLVSVSLPDKLRLFQNFPNPFNATTMIRFHVPARVGGSRTSYTTTRVRLAVYDVLGRLVAVLMDELKAAGWYEVSFDGSSYSTGMYVTRLEADAHVEFRKMVLAK